jgi:hypothetical protein
MAFYPTKYTEIRLVTFIHLSLLFLTSISYSDTITEDFESTVVPTIPTNWSLVGGVGTYETSSGNGNPNKSAEFSSSSGHFYLSNDGLYLKASRPINATFDFYVVDNGNYTNARVYFGDVQNGITGSANELIQIDLRERTFGSRANILDGSGTTIFDGTGNNQYRIDTNVWISANLLWTPTGTSTGNLSFSWTYPAQPNRGPMSVENFTFDSEEIYFGFGTTDDPVRYDNLYIQGTGPTAKGTLIMIQ